MEALSLLKFWRNRGPQVNEDSSDLAVTYPQCDFDKVVTNESKSSIILNTSVGITRLDNDTNKQYVHENSSILDGQAHANALNANVFSLDKLKINFKSRSSVLVLRSSPKLRVSMLQFKKSSSLDKVELNCITSMASPKREQGGFKSKREKSEDSSSSKSKYSKLIKQASKIFDQSVSVNSRADAEKQRGSRPGAFREVCKSLMKSKSSVRTVPVPVPVCRRDDSALEQQDGIQSAILHCKRSYSSSSSSSFSTISQECTLFSRSASESSHQKAAIDPQIISSAEGEMK
ncbi:hypothetical protein POM88_009347 [Heracleum sosnowskyi]|uniref:Membrane-associated kinase regulator 5 n=1 Tax=Heracleum sosnowskyi TaxID=360622 RepID=A0AAD8N7E2_9APIA|nr:hypothetical protein POM88_009347 [Heracleum sosnowskyi]